MVFSSQVCLRCFCGRFARVCWSLVLLIFLPKILKMFLFALCIMVICVWSNSLVSFVLGWLTLSCSLSMENEGDENLGRAFGGPQAVLVRSLFMWDWGFEKIWAGPPAARRLFLVRRLSWRLGSWENFGRASGCPQAVAGLLVDTWDGELRKFRQGLRRPAGWFLFVGMRGWLAVVYER